MRLPSDIKQLILRYYDSHHNYLLKQRCHTDLLRDLAVKYYLTDTVDNILGIISGLKANIRAI